MKKIILLSAAVITATNLVFSQGTAINNNGSAADSSAILDVSSTSQGILIPRMTETEKNAVTSPATGLMLYQTDGTSGFYYYNGSVWDYIGSDNLGNHIALDSLDMSSKKIVNLATCTNNYDAANKYYVDGKVGAGGGGGGGISIPSMISNMSSSGYILADAVKYCDTLSESSFSDWHLPTFSEISYFFSSSYSSDYLWTISPSTGKENPINQNYITVRLNDGKWKNGGETSGILLARTVSGNTTNDYWTTVATLTPITAGNIIVPTHIKFYGNRNSNSPCCQSSSIRLKFNLADGSYMYSSIFSVSTSSTTVADLTSIPLLTSTTPLSNVEVEILSYATSVTTYATLILSGYEIYPSQKDGETLKCRCVR